MYIHIHIYVCVCKSGTLKIMITPRRTNLRKIFVTQPMGVKEVKNGPDLQLVNYFVRINGNREYYQIKAFY